MPAVFTATNRIDDGRAVIGAGGFRRLQPVGRPHRTRWAERRSTRRSARVVVDHHPMLTARLELTPSARYELTAGTGFDAVAAVSALTSEFAVDTEGFDADLVRAHAAAAAQLDPAAGGLVRAALVRDPAGAGRVVVVIHHLGVDAVSWQAIIEDLIVAWAQRSAGHPYHLRAVGTSERAWMSALSARMTTRTDGAAEACWLARLPEHTRFPRSIAIGTGRTP